MSGRSRRFSLLALLGVTLLASHSCPARAQYPSPYNPYAPYYPPGWGAGGVLQGQAAVISAQGAQNIQMEQARLMREKALQAQQDTRKKTFDQLRYERENTPTYTEEQQRIEAFKISRLLNNAIPGEIQSGSAMNTLLPYLQRLMYQGTQGAPIPLDQELLRQVNVTAGSRDGSTGLLRNGGKLAWPFALRGPVQKQLDGLIPNAVAAAASNSLQPDLYYEISKGVDKLGDELSQNFRAEKIDGGAYLEGRRFLDSLRDSLKVLQAPNAADYFNGTYAAKGYDVEELLRYMTQKGLKFGPAAPGGEAAYQSLYNALVAYAGSAQNDSGFRMRMVPAQAAFRKH